MNSNCEHVLCARAAQEPIGAVRLFLFEAQSVASSFASVMPAQSRAEYHRTGPRGHSSSCVFSVILDLRIRGRSIEAIGNGLLGCDDLRILGLSNPTAHSAGWRQSAAWSKAQWHTEVEKMRAASSADRSRDVDAIRVLPGQLAATRFVAVMKVVLSKGHSSVVSGLLCAAGGIGH